MSARALMTSATQQHKILRHGIMETTSTRRKVARSRQRHDVRLLNAAGYRTRGGVLWHDSQVYRLLTDPGARGIYYFNRMCQLEKSWQTVPKPENEWARLSANPSFPKPCGIR